jgi:peptide/nickel transport system substrate-binding protein
VVLDPHVTTGSRAYGEVTPVYSTLTKFSLALADKPPSPDTIKGDAAQSWEMDPSGTRLTFKLRANHKFDPRPPTNGRAMTAQDVKWSWERTVAISPQAVEASHARNDAAPIESITAPDAQTVVVQLAYPYGGILELLAYNFLYVLPIEAEGYDPRVVVRGSGPFFLDTYEPSVRIVYRKNPDWYEQRRPFLDGIDRPIIEQEPTALTQFESGALWTLETVRQDDVLRLKRDHPTMVLTADPSPGTIGQLNFGLSRQAGSPLLDVRIRRALSMLVDREAIIDRFYGVSAFRDAGLPYETMWASHLPPSSPNWTDPRDKAFGSGAQWFEQNIDEAKKLMSAAGYNNQPIDVVGRSAGPVVLSQYPEIYSQMWKEGGFNTTLKLVPQTEHTALVRESGQGWPGIVLGFGNAYNEDNFLTAKYTPAGRNGISKQPIPEITDSVLKIRGELDANKRSGLVKALQRDLADQMPTIETDELQRGFTLRWPWFKNYQVFAFSGFTPWASSGRPFTEYWYDASAKSEA